MKWMVTLLCLMFCSLAAADEVKIGALLCLTGECGEWGQNSLEGMTLAIEEINKTGGILQRNISLEVEDSNEMKPSSAVSGLQKLLRTPQLSFIVGPSWTPASQAIAPVISQHPSITIISPSVGVRDFNEYADNIFNLWPHDEYATRALTHYALEHGKRIAIISSTQPWEQTQGRIAKEEIENKNGLLVAFEELPAESIAITAEVSRVLAQKPDTIIFTNFQRMGLTARAFKERGFRGQTLGVLFDETQNTLSQGAFEGMVVSMYPEVESGFQKRFSARFYHTPHYAASTAYDAVYLFAKAVQQVRSFDPTRVRAAMLLTQFSNGASGEVILDGAFRSTKRIPVLSRVTHGILLRIPSVDP